MTNHANIPTEFTLSAHYKKDLHTFEGFSKFSGEELHLYAYSTAHVLRASAPRPQACTANAIKGVCITTVPY